MPYLSVERENEKRVVEYYCNILMRSSLGMLFPRATFEGISLRVPGAISS